MDRTADLCSEDIVDEAVLLDSRQPGEAVRDDLGPKVIAAAAIRAADGIAGAAGRLWPLAA